MILVTGATGLVGTHLLVKLVKENYQVRALYRTESKKEHAKKILAFYFSETEKHLLETISWVKADICNVPEMTEAFNGVTHVYHCAAKISFNPAHYKALRKTNIEGTAIVVNLCLLTKVKKLCYVSSIATLGESPANLPIDENAEWNPEMPNSVYAITKYGAEMEVWRGVHEGLNAVIVNPGIIIGPGFFNSGSGVLFKKIYKGMNFYTTGVSGYISIHDVTTIMYRLMVSSSQNQRYILVGENISFKNAFGIIAKALGKPIPKKKASPFLMTIAYYIQRIASFLLNTNQTIFKSSIHTAFLERNYKNEKIKKELGYSFIPIEKSIKETARLFLDQC